MNRHQIAFLFLLYGAINIAVLGAAIFDPSFNIPALILTSITVSIIFYILGKVDNGWVRWK